MRSEDGLAGESHEHRRTTVERPLLRTPSNRVLASPPIGHRVVPLCTAVRLYSQLPSGSYLPSAEGGFCVQEALYSAWALDTLVTLRASCGPRFRPIGPKIISL